MSILLNNHGYDNASWAEILGELLPEQPLYIYNQLDNETLDAIASEIEYAVIWNHPAGDLQRYPNLKGILLLGAGTEHIDQDNSVPDLPIVRLIDPEVLNDMALYTLYWVMDLHRQFSVYRQQQQQGLWQRHDIGQPRDFRVTVLGLGAVGKTVAQRLHNNGFTAQGWDRYPQQIDGISCYEGDEQLATALAETDVLVNCLPLTAGTRHFINDTRLQQLPEGAALINISRGEVIDDQALLKALDCQHVSRAVLDAFAIEPLPEQSPYWQHPQVDITPHMSGATYARSAARLIADNIRRIENGEAPFPLHQHPSRIAAAS
ncbi:MAG: glyoxylate/hydroxypyruvate reductase A [Amphritea sp.]|nr:glyoxylate/hydroxypyruvate reductase A [Amphritea sp.]